MVPKSIRIGPKSCLGEVLGHLGPKMAPRARKTLKIDFWGPLLGAILGPKIKIGPKSDPKADRFDD